MIDLFENILIPIPARFLSALWNKYSNATVNVAILYNTTTNEVVTITAVSTKHRAIMWSDAVYDYINDYARSHFSIDASAHAITLNNLLS